MKKTLIIILLSIVYQGINAQEILGKWNGILNVMGNEMRLSFSISNAEDGYAVTMDSPDENVFGIALESVTFENQSLTITHSPINMEYLGNLNEEGIIEGNFNQNGYSFPLNLTKKEVAKTEILRPQEPKEPFPYYVEDVAFTNEQHTLAGTLTLPKKKGKFPVVILISGSGPQDRNEELVGHKPFLVLADHLTKKGIGVLRYDDRGTYASTGEFSGATSADFATDVEAAVTYLKTRKEINPKHIGLIGHSEGGIIAPMVAVENKDIDFIVLLAGPGVPLDELLIQQQIDISQVSGEMDEKEIQSSSEMTRTIYDLVNDNPDKDLTEELKDLLKNALEENPEIELPGGMSEEDFINSQIQQLMDPWFRYLLSYDPRSNLEKVTCPVLAINGSTDLQVASKSNLLAIEKALRNGGNKSYTTMELENLNHLFQYSETGNPSEYGQIEETFSEDALKMISDWISERVK